MTDFVLHAALGVSDDRGNALSVEIHDLLHAPGSNMSTVVSKLAEVHDPESVLIGTYLGLAILMNDKRAVPLGYRVNLTDPQAPRVEKV